MNRKLLLIGVFIIAIITFIEIAFYFIYIFKPVDRIAGKDIGVPKGIPTTSEILTPVSLSRYIIQSDESKILYSERLDIFIKDVESIMQSKSNFVKIVESNYTIAGTVVEIDTIGNTNSEVGLGYDITLKNLTGDKYKEHISASEARYTQVYLRTISSVNYSTAEKVPFDVKVGDYLIIKRSTNLLNPAEMNIEIEILRIAN